MSASLTTDARVDAAHAFTEAWNATRTAHPLATFHAAPSGFLSPTVMIEYASGLVLIDWRDSHTYQRTATLQLTGKRSFTASLPFDVISPRVVRALLTDKAGL